MRLIDADALLQKSESRELQPTKDTDGFIDGWCEGFNTVVDMIRNQPTAYNLDAVVEQLDKKETECFKNGSMGYLFPVYGEAKDIVRNGGKE